MTTQEMFLETADRIGYRLCRDAFWDTDRCTWLGWSTEPVDGSWKPVYRAFGADLYSGTSGICLFLAELHRILPDARRRKVLEGAIRQVLSQMDSIEGSARIGFFSGISGMAYALVRIGKTLEEEALVARGLAAMTTLAEVAPDPRLLDVIGGSAGAIPALLALSQHDGQEDMQRIAVNHGDHLIDKAIRSDRGWSWDTMHIPDQPPLTGHSHGTAGIATALLELYAATAETRFRDAALEALHYERNLFSEKHGNWPDLRIMNQRQPEQEPLYNLAWCHGAPGIGLSRLRCLDLLNGDRDILHEAEIAIRTTADALSAPWSGHGNYSLCHGAAGNAELLIEAARQLDRPELWQIAEKVGIEGRDHYAVQEMPWPCGVPGAGETPGLLLGLAGIGHFYLRLYKPEAIPSILLVTPLSEAASGEKTEKRPCTPSRIKDRHTTSRHIDHATV